MEEKKEYIQFEIVKQNGKKYLFIPKSEWRIEGIEDGKNWIFGENEMKGFLAELGLHMASPVKKPDSLTKEL